MRVSATNRTSRGTKGNDRRCLRREGTVTGAVDTCDGGKKIAGLNGVYKMGGNTKNGLFLGGIAQGGLITSRLRNY